MQKMNEAKKVIRLYNKKEIKSYFFKIITNGIKFNLIRTKNIQKYFSAKKKSKNAAAENAVWREGPKLFAIAKHHSLTREWTRHQCSK